MSSVEWYEEIDGYCRDYFNSPVTLFVQTRPNQWASQYLKPWLKHSKDSINDDALLQACDQAIQQYNQSSGMKRLWWYWSSPIRRLKTYHAMLALKVALHKADANPSELDLKRLHATFMNARIHREFFFWIYCGLRWLVGASNPWITEGLSNMNEKNEIEQRCDAQKAIEQLLSRIGFELNEYGTRRGKESVLVGELLKNKAECADKLGLNSFEACLQARARVTQREAFQAVKNSDWSRVLFEDKLIYYRAL